MKRWKLITGVLFVFVVGVLIGSLGTSIYINKRYFHIKHRPERRTEFIVQRFTERLGLDDAQQKEVAEIIKNTDKKAGDIFRQHIDQMDKFMDKEMQKVRALLNPDQREEFDRMREEFHENRKKREGKFPPEGPPGPGPRGGPGGFPDGKHGPPPPHRGPPPPRPPF